MRFAALIPLGLFVVVIGIVGARLLLLGRRSRKLPELTLGSGLLLLGFVGLPLAAMGRMPATVGTPVGHLAFAAGVATVVVGLSLLYVFNWRVFRATSPGVTAFVVAVFLALVCNGVGISWTASQWSSQAEILFHSRPYAVAFTGLVALQFAWGGVESLVYYRMLRRRLALGLADPVLVNRFLLWSVSAAAVASMCVGLGFCVLAGMSIAAEAVPLTLIAAAGGVASVTWSLTFFPPQAYQGFLRRRAAER